MKKKMLIGLVLSSLFIVIMAILRMMHLEINIFLYTAFIVNIIFSIYTLYLIFKEKNKNRFIWLGFSIPFSSLVSIIYWLKKEE